MRRLSTLLFAAALASLPSAAATLTLSGSGAQEPAAASVPAGTPGVYAGRVIMAANTGTITVSALQVATTGTGVAGTDVAVLQLYDDANNSGTFDGTDTLLGTGRWSSTSSRWVFSNLTVSVPTTAHSVFVLLSAGTGAVANRTFVMKVTQADVTVGAADTVATSTATGNTFTFASGAADGSANGAAPTVLLLNPSDGAAASGTFRVQVQVYNPGGLAALTAVKLSKNNGADAYAQYTFNLSTDLNSRYSVGTNAAVYETQLSLTPGVYTLKAQASNATASATSHGAVVTVNGAGVGDGNLLVRDNSSELCLDCHAMKTHSSQETGTQYGSWSVACRDCHTPHSTTNIYLVRRSITPPSANGFQATADVAFSTRTGDSGQQGLTNRPAASYANSDNSGPCQVCHTRTKNPATSVARWRNTAAGGNVDTHYAGASTTRCTSCHSHAGGFKAGESGGNSDCSSCHADLFTAMNGTTAYHHLMNNAGVSALASGSKYPKVSSLGVATDANRRCLACHVDHDLFRPDLNSTGGGRGKNLRTSANVLPGTSPGGAGFTQTDYGYASGTAAFNGTTTVTGTSTFWSGNVTAGAQTFIWNRCSDLWYPVSTVNSDTQLTLSSAGPSCADGAYRIVNLSSNDGSGLCLSCHATAQTKSYTQNDGTTQTPAINATAFRDSVHEFQASATFGGSAPQNTFLADCAKCHTDTLSKAKQTSAYPNQFGLHDSSVRRMNHPLGDTAVSGTATGTQSATTLVDTTKTWAAGQFDGYAVTIKDANGVRTSVVKSVTAPSTLNMLDSWGTAPVSGTTTYAIADPMEERFCIQCHSGGAAGSDYYGAKAMSDAAKRFDQYLKLYSTGTMSVAAAGTAVTGSGTTWSAPVAGSATFTQNNSTVSGSGTNWTASMVGWNIVANTATTPHQWYTIVKVTSATSLVISPSFREPTTTSTAWAVTIANWYLKCAADANALWYRIIDVGSATALTVYPAYPAACTGAYVARSSPGHPMSLSAGAHKPGESSLASPWNSGANRHVTCTDCHDAHAAQPGRHTAGGTGNFGAANTGTWGVAPTFSSRSGTVTFTAASRTVTSPSPGWFQSTDVGRNIVGLDGNVYPITAYASAMSISINTASNYRGTTATGTTSIVDFTAAPTYSVVASEDTTHLQAELCLKCHSSYAYASPPNTAFFNASGQGATASQTDIAKDFNPYQLAHHAVLGTGRNQPSTTANPNWASSAGRKANAPNTGLDNNFVDGWGRNSRVTCTDCHASDSPEDPWGPHGSANQWILKSIDPNVTVTIAGGTVTYPNRCYYKGSTSVTAGVPDTGDTKNICLNCHRADVYGLVTSGGSSTGSSCNTSGQLVSGITYANFARVNHPADGSSQSNSVGNGALTRIGIYCLMCHGGESLGAIHGTNSTNRGSGGSYRGKRFLVGATWIGVTRATTAAGVSCWTNTTIGAVNTCSHSHSGSTGNKANYDYESGAD